MGFGNMGCRHTQSLLNSDINVNIWVVEPNEIIFNENCIKIGASEPQIKRVVTIENIGISFDSAIVATSAKPRFEIVKELLKIGVKKLLLEKVVFQSEFQFNEIINLLESNGAKAYCNFVNRYYSYNQQLKSNLKKNIPINMSIIGGDFGLGCNGLHYLDLFEFLTESKAILKSYSLEENPLPHKRGNNFREVVGHFHLISSRGDSLLISSQIDKKDSVDIIVSQLSNTFYISEDTKTSVSVLSENSISVTDAHPIFSSSLTSIIMKDIMSGSILLPTVQETKSSHVQFFNAINKTLGISKNDLCPIT